MKRLLAVGQIADPPIGVFIDAIRDGSDPGGDLRRPRIVGTSDDRAINPLSNRGELSTGLRAAEVIDVLV